MLKTSACRSWLLSTWTEFIIDKKVNLIQIKGACMTQRKICFTCVLLSGTFFLSIFSGNFCLCRFGRQKLSYRRPLSILLPAVYIYTASHFQSQCCFQNTNLHFTNHMNNQWKMRTKCLNDSSAPTNLKKKTKTFLYQCEIVYVFSSSQIHFSLYGPMLSINC